MFIALPVGMNYRTERLPVITFSLIGINTLVYLVSLFFFFRTDGESDLWIMQHLWLIPSQSFLYTYLTSMFVHAGFLHLFGNMIFLFLFGSCVEDMVGRGRFLIYYLVGGFIAEMTYIAVSPAHFMSTVPMGGASGAISACMGMYLLLRANADIEFKYFLWIFFIYLRAGEFEIPAWMAISFWFLSDIFWMVFSYLSHQRVSDVAFGAHVGGLLGGLALIGMYKRLVLPHKNEEEEPVLIINPAAAIASASDAREMTSGETPTIFLYDSGEQTGPFTLSQVQVKLRRGEISRDARYWSEGMTGWENVSDLAGNPMQ